MKHIAIIPARSGSKGLKDKNIKLLNGKPMLAYTIEAAKQSGIYDCVHVSTDSEQYANIAREYGADVPFLRNEELSGDLAGSWDVLRWTMEQYALFGQDFDCVAMLQPTSPLRDAKDIQNAYRVFEEKQADSVISVCEVDHSLEICNTLDESDSMYGFYDEDRIAARQSYKTYYRLNGAIYILKAEILMNKQKIYGKNSFAYKMSKMHSIDIDDELDFTIAETILQKYSL